MKSIMHTNYAVVFAAVLACTAFTTLHAEDGAEENTEAKTEEAAAPKVASPGNVFFPLVRCARVAYCTVSVVGADGIWQEAEEGRYYSLGSTFRVEVPLRPGGAAEAVIALGPEATIEATSSTTFRFAPAEIGAAVRAVELVAGTFDVKLPRTLKAGLFTVTTPNITCRDFAGTSRFTYDATGDGDEVVVKCVTGSLALEGRHYKIAKMAAADQIRIRTTSDCLFTSLRGESGEYTVTLDQGLVMQSDFNAESGEAVQKAVTKTLDFSLSPKCAVKIWRRAAAQEGKMVVSMMTFDAAGSMRNRCAYTEGRANVNSGELVLASSLKDVEKQEKANADKKDDKQEESAAKEEESKEESTEEKSDEKKDNEKEEE